MARTTLYTTPLRRRKRRRRMLRTFGVALLSLSLVVTLGVFLRHERLRIASVTVVGNRGAHTETILALVAEHLGGSYGFLIPRRNMLLYPEDAIRSDLTTRLPRIARVNFLRDWAGRRLVIVVEERRPVALWCAEAAESDASCFFLDVRGFAFARAEEFGKALIRYTGNLPPSPIRTQYLPPEKFVEVESFRARLAERGLMTVVVSHDKNGDVTLLLRSGARLLFTDRSDLARIFENLLALITGPEAVLRSDALLAGVSYVDFRFGNKVFYKLR